MARLSVNLNKVALLRNSRHTGVPDPLLFARMVLEAGAAGITLHPRPDERHVRRADVSALSNFMKDWRPEIELNIEGYPDERILEIVSEVLPEQCTLVPDEPAAFTSEKGWDLTNEQIQIVVPAIRKLKTLGSRVILFIDPDPSVIERVKSAGADGVEIYTGTYAAAFRAGQFLAQLDLCVRAAERARDHNLTVNVGHDLNLNNLPPLVERIPFLAEASIGHELTADALAMGFPSAVKTYVKVLG
jgi:pyridoxine 5-phosphate synthase